MINCYVYFITLKKKEATKVKEVDCIKLKSFCTARDPSTKPKSNLLNGKKYIQII